MIRHQLPLPFSGHFCSLQAPKIYKPRSRKIVFKEPGGTDLKIIIGPEKIFAGIDIDKCGVFCVVINVPGRNNSPLGNGNVFHDVKTGSDRVPSMFRLRDMGF